MPSITKYSRKQGLTLVEVLVVVAIIGILAAIVLPTYARAKRAAMQSKCLSNLGQIGRAIGLYMGESDDKWPFGVDAADKYTPHIWNAFPQFRLLIPQIPLMQDLLNPYIGNYQVWECPADKGQLIDDVSFESINTVPSSFKTYGSSYYYRTEVTVRQFTSTNLGDVSAINIYFDGSGAWHTSQDILRPSDSPSVFRKKLDNFRYNVLFGDLHAKNISESQYRAAWGTPL